MSVQNMPSVDEVQKKLKETEKQQESLFRSWAGRTDIFGSKHKESFEKLWETSKPQALNAAVALDRTQKMIEHATKKYGEAFISSQIGLTPFQVLQVVRLAAPNTLRPLIFHEIPMQSWEDKVFFIKPTYAKTMDGVNRGEVTFLSQNYKSAGKLETLDVGTGNGTGTAFTGTLTITPIVPNSVYVVVGGKHFGVDDGAGNIVGANISTGSINYTTGAVSLTFKTAPATGDKITVEANWDSEANLNRRQGIELKVDYLSLTAQEIPLELSFTSSVRHKLESTLGIDSVDNELVVNAASQLIRSLDERAIALGYRIGLTNPLSAIFSAKPKQAESEIERARMLPKAIEDIKSNIFKATKRGWVSTIFGGTNAVNYLKLQPDFVQSTDNVGASGMREGKWRGFDVFSFANDTVGDKDTLTLVAKNPDAPVDTALVFGVYLLMGTSQLIEFSNFENKQGVAHYGTQAVNETAMIANLKITDM